MNMAWTAHPYLKIFLTGLIVTALWTPFIRWFAIRVGIMDIPSSVKVHHKPIPRLGGVAIFFGFLFSLLFAENITFEHKTVLVGGAMALVVGILDDARSVSAVVKLLVLFGITGFLASRGIVLHVTPWFWSNFILTLFWIVGVTSAFNAMDNMDGIAGGLTFFASAAYAYIAVQNHELGWGMLAVALMGSSIGFLLYNFPPASIFMGDSGSFFLGYCLATMSVMGKWSTNPFKAMAVPVFILGLPIFDLIYVVFRRHNHGITRNIREAITFSGKDHFTHRLSKFGMTHRQVVLFTYLSSLALGLGAVSMRYVEKTEAVILCVQVLIIIVLIIALMEFGSRGFLHKKEG